MSSKFSSGKNAIAECDRCGFRYKLRELKSLVIKTKVVNIKVCPTCWEKDQPQLQLGMYSINDAQAVRDPRPDNSYAQSRDIQWGWNPVGLNNSFGISGLTDNLEAGGEVGTVNVTIS